MRELLICAGNLPRFISIDYRIVWRETGSLMDKRNQVGKCWKRTSLRNPGVARNAASNNGTLADDCCSGRGLDRSALQSREFDGGELVGDAVAVSVVFVPLEMNRRVFRIAVKKRCYTDEGVGFGACRVVRRLFEQLSG